MKFNDLSIQEKAAVIKLGVGGGLRSLLEIRLFWDGMQGPDDPPVVLKVNNSKANFVLRLKDANRAYIRDWENSDNIATHKLSWATDDMGAIVYPNVLEVNGRLVDYTRPPYDIWAGYENAIRTGDTVMMTPEEAEWFTTHYKDYYPRFNEYKKGGSMNPDWDPENPYHYHTASGEKVVITPEDWERHRGLPYFKLIEDAVLAEQAAHPGPEYVINPLFSEDLRRVYKGNMGPKYQNYSSFSGNLPQGYSFTPEGLVQDNQGNLYVQKGFRQTPRFTYDENNPLVFPALEGRNQGNVTFYPVNMEKTEKKPLPVNNKVEFPTRRINYINSGLVSLLYPELATLDNRQDQNRGIRAAKQLGFSRIIDNYEPGLYNGWLIGFTDDELNKFKKKLWDNNARDWANHGFKTIGFDGQYYNYDDWFNPATLTKQDESIIMNTLGWRNGPNGNQGYQTKYEIAPVLKPYIEVGPLQVNDVQTYAKGGSIHIKPENRGKFNATKRRTGKTTEELTHSKNPLTRKRAIFAQNARKWHHKHPDGGGLTLKQNVRIRNNNSPTRELSEAIEDLMRIKISGPDPQYLIPYMPSKSIVINNSTTSTNVLDTLAKYAGIHNRDIKPSLNPIRRNPKPKYVDPWEVIGLASLETNFGAQPRTFINGNKQELRAYYNANLLTAYGDVPSWALMNDYHWLDTDRTEHPILDAIRYYSLGDYNTGDKNHTSDVKKRGNSIKNNKDVLKWWNESGKYIYNNEPTLEQSFWVEHAKTDPLNYLNGIFRYDKFGNTIIKH